jgi:F0F1-type ATP synthase membrane subunit b/b'
MNSWIAPIVGVVFAAILIALGSVVARRLVARAREEAPGILDDAKRKADDRAHAILAAAQGKSARGRRGCRPARA